MADNWYLSPKDKFEFELEFDRIEINDFVTIKQLDPIFQKTHLRTDEFLQMFQLIDIKQEHCLNKTQFLYFMHLLAQRRRGFPIPTGIPLQIKQEFLKEAPRRSRIADLARPRISIAGLSEQLNKTRELEQTLKNRKEEIAKVGLIHSTMHYRKEFQDLMTELTYLKLLINDL